MTGRAVRSGLLGLVAVVLIEPSAVPQEAKPPAPKPVPAMQVVPLPYDQASLESGGRELTRYHFGPGLVRPFWYPVAGPNGNSLTRMGHPHDPHGHRHHYSVWISHEKVNEVNFWADGTGARIVHQRVLEYEDGNDEASIVSLNAWQDKEGKTLMLERRRTAARMFRPGAATPTATNTPQGLDWLMVIDLELAAPGDRPVTLGQSPFGMIGVRMAKTIGVSDGGGRILNSAGQVNEVQVFRKAARWVDYSGPIAAGLSAGIALMDHPSNPDHPTPFHVRDDGWMGASLTLNRPLEIQPGKPLRLRYGLWVHEGLPSVQEVEPAWGRFAKLPLGPLSPVKK